MEAAASSEAPAPTQPADAPANQSPNPPLSPNAKYCAICTTLGKLHPNEFSVSQEWEEDSEEEKVNDQDKGEDNFSVCLDWDSDLKEQGRKNQEINNQKDNEGKTPQNSPTSLSATTITLQPSESSLKQLTEKSSKTPIEEENKCEAVTMILGHESSKSLEEVRLIKEALFIRVNNPSINRNIDKYHLPHIWDEVLLNTSELKSK